MKNIIFLSLFLFFYSIKASEFKSPNLEDLTIVSVSALNDVNELKIELEKPECLETVDQKNDLTEILNIVPPKNEVVCFCDTPEKIEDEKNLLYALVGNKKSNELTFLTGNDNVLHGVLQPTSLRQFDGDDKGRTVNEGINYRLVGDKGELNLKLESVGFGRLDSVDGFQRTNTGSHYLNFRERNTLDLQIDRNFYDNSKYIIGKFNFTHETDSGQLARASQEWWHNIAESQFGFKSVKYHYTNKEESISTISLGLGVGKKFINDIGNWKCQTKAEIIGGMSIDSSKLLHPEVSASIENKLSHKALPWVALTSWLQSSNGFKGPVVEGGFVLSAEKKMFNVIVRPYIGVERHIDPMDKKFGSLNGKAYENYHVFGVTIIY